MLCEPVSQAAFRLTDIQRKAKREAEAVNKDARSAGKGVSDTMERMVGACEDGCVGDRGKCDSVCVSRRMSGVRRWG